MPDEGKVCRLTNLTGMPILTQETGRKLGNVKDVIYDPSAGKLDAVTVERNGFFSPHRRFVLLEDIQSLGEDAIMVESGRVLRRPDRARRQERIAQDGVPLLGKIVVTEDGTILGSVSDVTIDPNTGKAMKYEVSGGALKDVGAGRRTLPIPEALVVGPDALVVPNSVEQELEAEPAGGIAGAYKETAAGAAGYWDRVKQRWNRITRRAARKTAEQESQFALGKTAGSTVRDDDGNVIVSKDERITQDIVQDAHRAGKLHQLALAAGWGATRAGYETAKERVTHATQEREEAYVIGKNVDRTIRDNEERVIIWSGDTVTQEIVDMARRAGKLEELTSAVAATQLRSGSRQASEEAQGWLGRLKEKAGTSGEEISKRRLTAEQRDMSQGKVSATDIRDKEGNIVIREGEIFTPMILSHLEDEGLLDQIHLKPVMGPERAIGEGGVPCVELVVRAEDVHRK